MANAPTEIKSLARSHTKAAVKTLVGIMNQRKATPSARVSAAEALLNRGWGKPVQPVAGGDDDDNPINIIQRIERSIVDPTNTDSESIPPVTGTGKI